MNYYVYLYLDEDATPYYVGKGTNSRCTDCHGDIPIPPDNRITKILEGVEEKEALKKEAELINKFGRIEDGGTLMNRVVPTGKSRKRPGSFCVNFEPTLFETYKKLCRDQGLAYTKVLERFAEYYVSLNGEVDFLKTTAGNRTSKTISERLDLLERAMSKIIKSNDLTQIH